MIEESGRWYQDIIFIGLIFYSDGRFSCFKKPLLSFDDSGFRKGLHRICGKKMPYLTLIAVVVQLSFDTVPINAFICT